MALPDWLTGSAQNFISQYSGLVFDPTTGAPRGLPSNVQQQTAPMTQQQYEGLYGINKQTPYAQNVADTAAGQATSTMQGQYLNPGSTGNQWLSSGLQNLGVGQTSATMSGQYLNPSTNPYLAGTFQSAASPMIQAYQTATAPGNFAAAQRAGQFGSTAMNEQGQLNQYGLGQNLQNLASNIYGGAYQQERGIQANTTNQVQQSQNAAFQNERGRQLQALSMAPGTAQGLYAPSQALFGAGAQQQQQQQTQMDTQYANAVAQYEAPYNQMQGFGNAMLTGGGGGSTAQTQTKSGSVICTLLHNKGLTDDETYEAAGEFGKRQSEEMRKGYRSWAVPLTRAMDKSPLLMLILKPFWTAWQKEMFARVKGGKGSILGKILLKVGMPLSAWLGRSLLERQRFSCARVYHSTNTSNGKFGRVPKIDGGRATVPNISDKQRLHSQDLSTPLPVERQQFRKSIMALQNAMVAAAANGTLKVEDYPLHHYFEPFDERYFCYAREIFIPKGQIVIGKIHRHSHLNIILKGKCSVGTEFGPKYFEAPCIFVSEVGIKRAVITEEDTVWVTVHLVSRSGAKNLEAIEDELIAKSYEELRQ